MQERWTRAKVAEAPVIILGKRAEKGGERHQVTHWKSPLQDQEAPTLGRRGHLPSKGPKHTAISRGSLGPNRPWAQLRVLRTVCCHMLCHLQQNALAIPLRALEMMPLPWLIGSLPKK